METEQLRQLVTIADEGTMIAAAELLGISQPALSRSMQRLEDDLGHPLFARHGRTLRLTDMGRTAVDWSRQLLRDERMMRDSLDTLAQRETTLRVGTVAPAPLWRLTTQLMSFRPGETLTSQMIPRSEILTGLRSGSLDLGILNDEDGGKADQDTAVDSASNDTNGVAETDSVSADTSSRANGFESVHLMDERLSVILPPGHPLSNRPSVTAAMLDGETFLVLADTGFWDARMQRALQHSTFIRQSEPTVFAELARSTPYCMFITDAPGSRDVPAGHTKVALDDPAASASFSLVLGAHASALARGFFDRLRH